VNEANVRDVDPRHGQMLTPPPARSDRRSSDPGIAVVAALLVAGVVTTALAGWLAYRFSRGPGPQGSQIGYDNTKRALIAEQTRDAQQAEIERLRSDLERAQQALTSASTEPDDATPTASSGASLPEWETPPLALILDAPVYRQGHSLRACFESRVL